VLLDFPEDPPLVYGEDVPAELFYEDRIEAEHCAMVYTGLSRAQREEIEPDDAVLEAAQVCPVEAILVRENASGRLLAPAE
jgi:ferredoxin